MFDFLQLLTKQREPQHAAEGQPGRLQVSRLGQLFTSDWRERLRLAGRCFNITIGDPANSGGAPSLVQGGGAGTTIDSDQPEMIVGVRAGYYMIPLRFQASIQVDLDADAEIGDIVLFADTTQAPPVTATATAEVPISLLGTGLVTSIAEAWSAVTADITDPVASILLAYETVREAEISAVAHATVKLSLLYEPLSPPLLKGPCSVVACWGGTAAVNGLATFDWAEIPASWIE